MQTKDDWFIEYFKPTGSAIGYRISDHLDHVVSDYQTIDIYQTTDWGKLMVIDGAVMLTSRDNFLYHEMLTHPALFIHPNPQHIVIVGGGDCGSLRETLKHLTVQSVTLCDIDEVVTRMAEKHFPELCHSNQDPRAEIRFGDGCAYVRQLPSQSVDLIIVDSTDPVGPAEGLFNHAFYSDCMRALKQDGLLVQQSESPLGLIDLIKQMHNEMRRADFSSLRTLPFPQPCYPTGWWSVTIASKNPHFSFERRHNSHHFSIETQYYCSSIHQAAIKPPPFLACALNQADPSSAKTQSNQES